MLGSGISENLQRILGHRLLLAVFLATSFGCPPSQRLPTKPPLSKAPVNVRRDFSAAQALYEHRKYPQAARAFRDFVQRYASDPLSVWAQLYLARTSIKLDQLDDAEKHLSLVSAQGSPNERMLARYEGGLLAIKRQRWQLAEEQLAPLLGQLPSEREPELLALLLHSSEMLGQHARTIEYADKLYQRSERPAERALARRTIAARLAQLAPPSIEVIYRKAAKDALLRALAGTQLVKAYRAQGQLERANDIADDIADACERSGLPSPKLANSERAEARIGVLLPASGRYQQAGRLALRGVALGLDAQSTSAMQHAKVKQPQLLIRDSSHDPAAQARQLIVDDRVIALIGGLRPEASQAIAAVAARFGVPYLPLGPTADSSNPWTFRILPDAAARIEGLLHHAQGTTPLRTIVLAPQSPYGNNMSALFRRLATARRFIVVGDHRYPPSATSFVALAKRIATLKPQIVFIPDTAQRIALLAPALAAQGLWSRRSGSPPPPNKGLAIRILATADGLNARLLASAASYLQGALLSPGYFGEQRTELNAVESTYLARHRQPASLLVAYAFDATLSVVGRLDPSTPDRNSLSQSLRNKAVLGLTGPTLFGANGKRMALPPTYEVVNSQVTLLPQPATN
ncbi:MAG: ABC transporter substrate-binding protein [Deltaproteobacteria bacterium]|nr:ABC transporter substrate-binding protein [Deltaproteobacteria bacterium]